MQIYNYKGHEYRGYEETEFDGDNTKIFHMVKAPGQDREIHMDFTPYDYPTEKEFKMWIDMGKPGRITTANGTHNFGPDDLARMWESWSRDKDIMDEIHQAHGPQPVNSGPLKIDGKVLNDAGKWVKP
jgi:hypothetical protein